MTPLARPVMVTTRVPPAPAIRAVLTAYACTVRQVRPRSRVTWYPVIGVSPAGGRKVMVARPLPAAVTTLPGAPGRVGGAGGDVYVNTSAAVAVPATSTRSTGPESVPP